MFTIDITFIGRSLFMLFWRIEIIRSTVLWSILVKGTFLFSIILHLVCIPRFVRKHFINIWRIKVLALSRILKIFFCINLLYKLQRWWLWVFSIYWKVLLLGRIISWNQLKLVVFIWGATHYHIELVCLVYLMTF